jgi:hypothetical protein
MQSVGRNDPYTVSGRSPVDLGRLAWGGPFDWTRGYKPYTLCLFILRHEHPISVQQQRAPVAGVVAVVGARGEMTGSAIAISPAAIAGCFGICSHPCPLMCEEHTMNIATVNGRASMASELGEAKAGEP